MKKLNLGCRNDKKKGWINIDSDKTCNPDLILDLNKFPYPFKDDSIDEIFASNILEHLKDTKKVLKEWERICKNNAKIMIRVPHYLNPQATADITHVAFFNGQTFDVLNLAPEYNGIKMSLEKVEYESFLFFGFFLNLDRRLTELFLARFIPIITIKFYLKVVK